MRYAVLPQFEACTRYADDAAPKRRGSSDNGKDSRAFDRRLIVYNNVDYYYGDCPRMLDSANRLSGQGHWRSRLPWLNLLGLAAVFVAATLVTAKNLQSDPANEILKRLLRSNARTLRRARCAIRRRISEADGHQITHQTVARRLIATGTQRDRWVAKGPGVVTLALPTDVETLAKRGLIAGRLAGRAYRTIQCLIPSTVVFVVRKGNPKAIHDWPDLIKGDVAIVTPNPRTSGNGKLSVLAAWGAVTTRGGSAAQALAYLKALFQHVAVFDAGARGAATSFAIEKVGDVHLTWGERGAARGCGR